MNFGENGYPFQKFKFGKYRFWFKGKFLYRKMVQKVYNIY